MLDKDIAIKGIDWVRNHSKQLYKRDVDFDEKEIRLFDNASDVLITNLLANGSLNYGVIPLMLEILYIQSQSYWDYVTDDEWIFLVKTIEKELADCRNAIQSDDKEKAYNSLANIIEASGMLTADMVNGGRRKTTPKEWQDESTLESLNGDLLKLTDSVEKIERDIESIKLMCSNLQKDSKA